MLDAMRAALRSSSCEWGARDSSQARSTVGTSRAVQTPSAWAAVATSGALAKYETSRTTSRSRDARHPELRLPISE